MRSRYVARCSYLASAGPTNQPPLTPMTLRLDREVEAHALGCSFCPRPTLIVPYRSHRRQTRASRFANCYALEFASVAPGQFDRRTGDFR
jgi:hypothetical protein